MLTMYSINASLLKLLDVPVLRVSCRISAQVIFDSSASANRRLREISRSTSAIISPTYSPSSASSSFLFLRKDMLRFVPGEERAKTRELERCVWFLIPFQSSNYFAGEGKFNTGPEAPEHLHAGTCIYPSTTVSCKTLRQILQRSAQSFCL